tara:strand:+ start:1100 stop:1330 length:231 start_codon:yes stop_codon:yes gene_type:complete
MKLTAIIPLVSVLLFPGVLPVQAQRNTDEVIDLILRMGVICDKVPLEEPYKYDKCINDQLELKSRRNLFELESTPN